MRRAGPAVRIQSACVVAIAVLASVAVGPSAVAASRPDPAPSTSTQVRQEARATAAKVEQLTREYRRRERVAARSADALAEAFRMAALAEQAHQEAQDALRRSRVRQAARVRALYVEGGSGLTLSALAASSPSDAVWRVTVGRRIGADVVRVGAAEVRRMRRDQEVAARRQAAADQADQHLGAALARFSEESEAAARVLAQAQADLDTLSATAQRLAAAEKAAAELAAARALAARSPGPAAAGAGSALAIPPDYEASYRAAAGRCTGLRWTLLAALGQVESGHGRSNGPSSAGAVGPMQFMPATFASYGVDGDGDGIADAWNYADAIPSAAAYLCASGLDGSAAGVRRALLAYNHAQWYVDLVLATERAITQKVTDRAAG